MPSVEKWNPMNYPAELEVWRTALARPNGAFVPCRDQKEARRLSYILHMCRAALHKNFNEEAIQALGLTGMESYIVSQKDETVFIMKKQEAQYKIHDLETGHRVETDEGEEELDI